MCVLCCGEAAAARRALLVGIDRYDEPGPPVGTNAPSRTRWPSLDGAVNDVVAIRDLLQARFGFAPGDIVMLTNGLASREAILRRYEEQLIAPSRPGDVALFYYSGHGSQVANSKSAEPDGMDETIVPADANRGAPDLRDKELRRLHVAALAKGARLVVVMDSCHSGSAARGITREGGGRFLPPVNIDVADGSDPGQSPEDRGAVIFSAAQDFQLAREDAEEVDGALIRHGAFSLALIRTLRSVPPGISADEVFLRVRGLLKAKGWVQDPVLGGMRERRQEPVFGGSADGDGRLRVTVLRVDPDGSVVLLGGRATGLSPGCEFVPVSSTGTCRLIVGSVDGLDRCIARIAGGGKDTVHPGDVLALSKWVPSYESWLRVCVPAQPPSARALAEQVEAARVLRAREEVRWIDEPLGAAADVLVRWEADGWVASPRGRAPVPLGASWRADDIVAACRGLDRPAVLVEWPPSAELAAAVGRSVDGLDIRSDRTLAMYVLAGRLGSRGIEYAWVQPEADAAARAALPARTDWVAAAEPPLVREALLDAARRLARPAGWLLMPEPPDEGRFPYHLAFREEASGGLRRSGDYRAGESFGLVLERDPSYANTPIQQRYVYVFYIDCAGRGTLLFPPPVRGSVENRFPLTKREIPREIALGEGYLRRLTIAPPLGVDTCVMVSSVEPLADPATLEFDGARSRGGAPVDPLRALVGRMGGATRGDAAAGAASTWGLDRVTLHTLPREGAP